MRRLLIVDDQEVYVKSLSLALRRHYDIVPASTAEQALAMLESADTDSDAMRIELALIDIRLDENDDTNSDGLTILEWVRMNKPDIAVFVMSAYREFSYAERALNLGARHFFKKPIDIVSLIAILEEKS